MPSLKKLKTNDFAQDKPVPIHVTTIEYPVSESEEISDNSSKSEKPKEIEPEKLDEIFKLDIVSNLPPSETIIVENSKPLPLLKKVSN